MSSVPLWSDSYLHRPWLMASSSAPGELLSGLLLLPLPPAAGAPCPSTWGPLPAPLFTSPLFAASLPLHSVLDLPQINRCAICLLHWRGRRCEGVTPFPPPTLSSPVLPDVCDREVNVVHPQGLGTLPPPVPTPDVRNREIDAVNPQGLREADRLVAIPVLFPVAVERDDATEGPCQVLLQEAEQRGEEVACQ